MAGRPSPSICALRNPLLSPSVLEPHGPDPKDRFVTRGVLRKLSFARAHGIARGPRSDKDAVGPVIEMSLFRDHSVKKDCNNH